MNQQENYNFLKIDKLRPLLIWGPFFYLLYYVVSIFSSYLYSFFIAGVIYLMFQPTFNFFTKKWAQHKKLLSILFTLGVIFLIIIPLMFLIQALSQDLNILINYLRTQDLIKILEEFYKTSPWIHEYLSISLTDIYAIKNKVLNYVAQTNSTVQLLAQGTTVITWLFNILLQFFIMIFTLFFLFLKGDKIFPVVAKYLPFPDHLEKEISDISISLLNTVIKGSLFIALCQGALITIYFYIFDLATPILYGTIASICSLIPIVGTSIIWLPASIFLYINTSIVQAIIMAIISLVSFIILENIIKPLLLDRKLPIPSFILFLSILGGIQAFGFKGIILGPFLVAFFVNLIILLHKWHKQYVNE